MESEYKETILDSWDFSCHSLNYVKYMQLHIHNARSGSPIQTLGTVKRSTNDGLAVPMAMMGEGREKSKHAYYMDIIIMIMQ